MRNPRDRREPNKLVIHSTIRTTHALPFVARQYMNAVIWGILARGQEKYPVQVVAYIVMPNHIHAILAGRGQLISNFNNYVHGELAQAVKAIFPNLFLGNVWSSRPHEQVLGTPEDVLQKIAYLYANPCRAQQVNTIDNYAGVSTWQMFKTDSHVREHAWLPRRILRGQPMVLTLRDERTLIFDWKRASPSKHTFVIKPYVWKRCFEESSGWTDERIRLEVISRVAREEAIAVEYRKRAGAIQTNPHENDPQLGYRPKEGTPTPFVQCQDNERRIEYITEFKKFCEMLRHATIGIRMGKALRSLTLPQGGYLPGGMLTSVFLFALGTSP